MRLYLDRSSIVKLYVQEPGHLETLLALNQADEVASADIAYAEVRSALARARRGRRIPSIRLFQQKKLEFETDWGDIPSFLGNS